MFILDSVQVNQNIIGPKPVFWSWFCPCFEFVCLTTIICQVKQNQKLLLNPFHYSLFTQCPIMYLIRKKIKTNMVAKKQKIVPQVKFPQRKSTSLLLTKQNPKVLNQDSRCNWNGNIIRPERILTYSLLSLLHLLILENLKQLPKQ